MTTWNIFDADKKKQQILLEEEILPFWLFGKWKFCFFAAVMDKNLSRGKLLLAKISSKLTDRRWLSSRPRLFVEKITNALITTLTLTSISNYFHSLVGNKKKVNHGEPITYTLHAERCTFIFVPV